MTMVLMTPGCFLWSFFFFVIYETLNVSASETNNSFAVRVVDFNKFTNLNIDHKCSKLFIISHNYCGQGR